MNSLITQPLYTTLHDEKREIRLLDILPNLDDSQPVHCQLFAYSLEDLNDEYKEFLTENSATQGIGQHPKQEWTSYRLSHRLATQASLRRMQSTRPSPNLYRFQWGDFAALSYVWGEESNAREIIVNGHPVSVTANLDTALRQFRKQWEFSGHFKLWADSLCINQRDFIERAHHVRMMRDLYGSAWSVIAWLGKEEHHSTSAIQLLSDLAAFKDAGCVDEMKAHLVSDPLSCGVPHWPALESLMNRPYWTRLWIFQEIVIGGAATWLRCGNATINWKTFCTAVSVLQEQLWLEKDTCLQLAASVAGVNTEQIWRTKSLHLVYQDLSPLTRQISEKRIDFSFERLLDLANSGNCTNSRDRVYALIGLMSPTITHRLSPDYKIPVWRVYVEAARVFIQAEQSLDPLREGNPWGPAKGPSWAADWAWPGRIRWTRPHQHVWGPVHLFPRDLDNTRHHPYRASGDVPANARLLRTGILQCNGFVVDTICGLSARNIGYFEWSRSSIVRQSQWNSVYGDRLATSEALYRTLVADRASNGNKAEARHAAILHLPHTFELAKPQFAQRGWAFLGRQEGYYFRWERFRSANWDFLLGEDLLDSFFSDDIPADASEYDFCEVYSCSDRSAKKRRFMTTMKGYMGWAPDNIFGKENEQSRAGDLIAIIFGCSTPLAIRPCGDRFQVLGEAYVQGLMDGEAIDALREGKHATQSFVFC
ncbi:HET domain containing protein [Pyrenophora teres f. maculata]|nr:HET domain containing protein [Pyrenophora teres f. maculata]